MEDKKLIKISKAILVIGIIAWAIVCCTPNIASPEFTAYIFENYTGQSWNDLMAQQPRQATLYHHVWRMVSIYWLIGALYALFILFTSYGRGNRSAWIVLLIGTTLLGLVPIIFGMIFSDPIGIMIGIASLIVDWVALGIGAKAVWSSKKM